MPRHILPFMFAVCSFFSYTQPIVAQEHDITVKPCAAQACEEAWDLTYAIMRRIGIANNIRMSLPIKELAITTELQGHRATMKCYTHKEDARKSFRTMAVNVSAFLDYPMRQVRESDLAFIIAHELAHIVMHCPEGPTTQAHEIEADSLATYWLGVTGYSTRNTISIFAMSVMEAVQYQKENAAEGTFEHNMYRKNESVDPAFFSKRENMVRKISRGFPESTRDYLIYFPDQWKAFQKKLKKELPQRPSS